ncbi:UNVERIFIED_CONTAM: hypothetical protein PYX00_002963 [Menopon gallinae]|uniref:Uncharacterized protein n=1 Tax=Menopon gallinae TaxID=328185 RepID=A0AAW2HZ63_9NEOP
MAWGYWSATSVLPDRGRSPRRQNSVPPSTPAVPVMTTPSVPGGSSEAANDHGQHSASGSPISEDTEELPSRRPSLEIPGPPRGMPVMFYGGASRSDSLRRRYTPDDRDIIVNQHDCYVHSHQPTYVPCHIHDRERIRRTTDGLSDSEEESSDPGDTSGIRMFTLSSDNEEDGSEPCYESGTPGERQTEPHI